MLGRVGGDFGRMGLVAPSGHFAGASLDLNFVSSSGYPAAPSLLLSTTRASDAYSDDTAGNWSLFASGVPRITDKGLLVEEARTNSIRNNSMQGAVAGSPGTLPTNWVVSNAAGLTTNVIGTGTENGVDYVDLQIVGTANGAQYTLRFEGNTAVAATLNSVWTGSLFHKLAGGTTNNISGFTLSGSQHDAGGVYLTQGSVAFTPTATLTRASNPQTLSNASVAYANMRFTIDAANLAAVDITLRIGWPQLELGAFATSPIRTTSAAATRAADGVTTAMAGTSEGAVVVYARTAPGVGATNQALWCWDDGTNQNRLLLYRRTSDRLIVAEVSVAGVNQAPINLGAVADDTAFKVGLSWKANDFVALLNGGTPVTDASGSVPAGLTTVRHGATTGGVQWNGAIQREAIFPAYRSAAQLQALTA